MGETRLDREIMPSVITDDLTAKLICFRINTENKELLKLFMAMFSTMYMERNSRTEEFNEKVTSIQSKNRH